MARKGQNHSADLSDGEVESDSTSTGSDCCDGQAASGTSTHSAFAARWLCLVLVPVVCIFTGTLLFVTRNRRQPAVLHFQFLAIDDLPHGWHWRRFFDGAPPGSFTVWLHCKDRAACLRGEFLRHVPETRVVPSVPTVYCKDLVTAQIQLLRFALELPPQGEVEKFLLISDSTLPIKPFNEVLSALAQNAESDFCIFAVGQWTMWAEVAGGRKARIIPHSQFVQLNRKDARTFVKRWDDTGGGLFVNSVGLNLSWEGNSTNTVDYPAWNVPVLSGDPARYLQSLDIQEFPHYLFCTDEVAAFSSIFGAIVFGEDNLSFIDGFGTLRYEGSHDDNDCSQYGYCSRNVQGRCFTYFSFWEWSMDDYMLEGDTYADPDSVVYPTSKEHLSHPVTFGNLSRKALQRLRRSPWLFARKFSADAHLPDYEDEILGIVGEEKSREPAHVGDVCEERTFGTGSKASGSGAVLHFLFLAVGAVHHAEVWEQFFAHAPRKSWRVWLHCKEPGACRNSSFYRRIQGVNLVSPVRYIKCNDEVSATVQMMKEALAAGAAAPLEKFVLVSDSTLPVKPFSEVYRVLTLEGTSDFCFYPKKWWLRADTGAEHLFALWHQRWMVLNRLDAAKLVCRWRPRFDSDMWPDWDVRLHGRSRAIAKRDLLPLERFGDGEGAWPCTASAAPFGLLYGAFTPGADGTQHYPGFGTISARAPAALAHQGRCRTLAIWGMEGSDELKRQLLGDPGTTLLNSTYDDPATFVKLSDAALRSLRASDFLFTMKVQANASLPHYSALMFSE